MKVILFGYYGFRNTGDEQLLDETIRLLKESSSHPNYIVARGSYPLPFPTFKRTNYLAWIYYFWKSDAIIFGGGSIFQSQTSFYSLLYYLVIVQIAMIFRVKVILLCQGWGPFKSRYHQHLATRILSKPMVVRSWRDELAKSSFTNSKDHVFCDLTLLQNRDVEIEPLKSSKISLGISILQNEFNTSLKQLRERYPDIDAHYIITQPDKNKQEHQEFLLDDLWDQSPPIHLLITQRYHSAIWASKFGIPWVAVSDDPKLQALAQDTLQPIISLSDRNLVDKLLEFVQSFPEPVRDQRLMDWYDSFKDQRHRVIGWLDEHLSN